MDGREDADAARDVAVYADATTVRAAAVAGEGALRFTGTTPPGSDHGTVRKVGADRYELPPASGRTYVVERRIATR